MNGIELGYWAIFGCPLATLELQSGIAISLLKFAVMGFLIAYLLGVLTAVRSKDHNREHIDPEPNKGTCNPLPDRPITVVSIPPAPTDQERAKQKKKDRHDNITFWVGISTLIVLSFYTAFTYKIMRASLNASATADNTFREVQKQTVLMRQQLVGSQEAVIDLAVSYNEGNHELITQVINNGHVNATDIHLKIDASQRRMKTDTLIGEPFHFEPVVSTVLSGRSFQHNWVSPWPLTEKERQQGGSWPRDWPGNRTFVFTAEITYKNGFDDERRQSVCKKWVPGFSIVYRAQGSGGGGLVDCSNFTNFIKSTLEQEKKAEQGAERPY